MPEPYDPIGRTRDDAMRADPRPGTRNDNLDDEERILAGRLDVNMPALLTRDVKGG